MKQLWARALCMAAVPGAACVLVGTLWAKPDETAVREDMGRIFASMQVLLPASVDRDRFRDPAQAEAIRNALTRVSESAGAVAEHAGSREQGARFLGRSLQQEARRTAAQFERKEYATAQYSILLMTEYCVECHSRTPIPDDSPLSSGFVSAARFENLGFEERARLQFATRQFEAGLDTLERLLASPEMSATTLLEAATNHVVVSVRVKQNFERPAGILRSFAARPDLPPHLQQDVQRWVESLASLSTRVDGSRPARLEAAIDILSEARDVTRFASERQALVQYAVASMLLQRVVERPALEGDKARAYYWLGFAELRLGRNYWLGLPEFFLETAIRLDPGGERAPQAFALIEESLLSSYSLGIEDRSELPLDVEQRLEDLRSQVEAARNARERKEMDRP